MNEDSQFYYHCHGCGQFFLSKNEAPTCENCGLTQRSAEAWDRVIARRDQGLAFGKIEKLSDERLAIEKEDKMAPVLDIMGRKKAKRNTLFVAIGVLWIVGILGLAYKVALKHDEASKQVHGRDSITLQQLSENETIIQECTSTFQKFLLKRKVTDISPYITPIELDTLLEFYRGPNHNHSPLRVIDTHSKITETRADIIYQNPQGQQFETVFHKVEDQWLLDWKAFVNYSDITFGHFLTEKPLTPHKFRLLISADDLGLEHYISFIGYNRNNNELTSVTTSSATIKITNEHPQYENLIKVIKASELYQEYNDHLPEKDAGCLGISDPSGYYRVTVTLAFEEDKDFKNLVVKEVHGAHWMGDFHQDFLREEQQLIFDRRHSK